MRLMPFCSNSYTVVNKDGVLSHNGFRNINQDKRSSWKILVAKPDMWRKRALGLSNFKRR